MTTPLMTTRVATFELGERKASPDGIKRFPAVLSTETPVPRSDRFGRTFDEVLSHAPGAVDLSRAPLPLIESHDRSKVNIGLVENIRLDGSKLRGDLVLGQSARAQELAKDITARLVTGISIAYQSTEIEASKDGAVQTSTRWTPFEVSIVSVPADIQAGIFRSSPAVQEKHMPPEVDPQNQSLEQRAMQTERERVQAIQFGCRKANLPTEFGDKLITDGTPIDQARALIIDQLVVRSDAIKTMPAHDVDAGGYGRFSVGRTARQGFVEGASRALMARSGVVASAIAQGKPGFKGLDIESNSEFRGLSLYDMARDSLERQGVSTRGMGRQEVAGRALTFRSGGFAPASDFVVLYEQALGKILEAGFALAPDQWRKIAKVELVPDFRDSPRYRTGSFGTLPVVKENEQYKHIAIPDGSKLSISTETRGAVIGLSRRAIIDDDMSANADLASRLGRSAGLTIEREVFALLAQNSGLGPTMADGQPFFHSTHGNLNGVGSALSIAGLDADRIVMKKFKDPSNNEYLGLKPHVLLTAPELETAARRINQSLFLVEIDGVISSGAGTANPIEGLFAGGTIGSPYVEGNRRYMFTDPSVCPAIVVAFLAESGQAPYLESRQGFDVDGLEWKVRLDAKVNPYDYRGCVTNAGQ